MNGVYAYTVIVDSYRINEKTSLYGIITASSEDEAYGKALKRAKKKFGDHVSILDISVGFYAEYGDKFDQIKEEVLKMALTTLIQVEQELSQSDQDYQIYTETKDTLDAVQHLLGSKAETYGILHVEPKTIKVKQNGKVNGAAKAKGPGRKETGKTVKAKRTTH